MATKNFTCFSLLLSLLSLTWGCAGCGGGSMAPQPKPQGQQPIPVTVTAAQVFNTGMIGQTWTFQNGYGDKTFISVEPAPASNYLPAGSVVLHYTKTACRAYWGAGICDAELWFPLSPQPDGAWVSKISVFSFPTQTPAWANGNHLWTSDDNPIPGMPAPYTIIPAKGDGTVVSVPTAYQRWDAPGVHSFDSIISGPFVEQVPWRTDSYAENVTTPVYSGPALVSEQFESACIHEKWYFAPNLGLVKVIPLDNGSCTPGDPQLTMVRIH